MIMFDFMFGFHSHLEEDFSDFRFFEVGKQSTKRHEFTFLFIKPHRIYETDF